MLIIIHSKSGSKQFITIRFLVLTRRDDGVRVRRREEISKYETSEKILLSMGRTAFQLITIAVPYVELFILQ